MPGVMLRDRGDATTAWLASGETATEGGTAVVVVVVVDIR